LIGRDFVDQHWGSAVLLAAKTDDSNTMEFSAAILAVWLMGFLPMESGAIWIPTARIAYGIDGITMGLLASAQFAVSACMAMFITPRLAQSGLRLPLLIAGGIILAAALATAALPLSFAGFAVARVIEGGCCGLCVASAAILASRTGVPARSFGIMQFSQIIMNMVVYVSSASLVLKHGLSGLYTLIFGATLVFVFILALGRRWAPGVAPVTRVAANQPDLGWPKLRILVACTGAAFVYCGFIALVANATALGNRAGLDFAHVTKILAAGTPAAAVGALIATIFAKRVPPVIFLGAAVVGAACFGLLLTYSGASFFSLLVPFCGVIFCVYIGFPSIFGGIARLDASGRSAAAAQAAQMFGPALGPAVGAIVAAHSVAGFAFMSAAFIALGSAAAAIAVIPRTADTGGPAEADTRLSTSA